MDNNYWLYPKVTKQISHVPRIGWIASYDFLVKAPQKTSENTGKVHRFWDRDSGVVVSSAAISPLYPLT